MKDALDLFFCGACSVLGAYFATKNYGEHGVNTKGADDLVDRRRGVTRKANVSGPVEHVAENLVLVLWIGFKVVTELDRQVGHGARETWKVEELTCLECLSEIVHQTYEEFFGGFLVLCKFPDNVIIQDVARRHPPHRAF